MIQQTRQILCSTPSEELLLSLRYHERQGELEEALQVARELVDQGQIAPVWNMANRYFEAAHEERFKRALRAPRQDFDDFCNGLPPYRPLVERAAVAANLWRAMAHPTSILCKECPGIPEKRPEDLRLEGFSKKPPCPFKAYLLAISMWNERWSDWIQKQPHWGLYSVFGLEPDQPTRFYLYYQMFRDRPDPEAIGFSPLLQVICRKKGPAPLPKVPMA